MKAKTTLPRLAVSDTIIDIIKRKQILSDIASAQPAEFLKAFGAGNMKSPHWRAVESIKVRVEGSKLKSKSTVVEIRFRDPSTAIEELNRMGGISPGKAG